jgi:DNA-binding response OmpR family regulator
MPHKRKVLLVEDDILLYDQLSDLLTEKGFHVLAHPEKTHVANYDDAIHILESTEPDIAILDISIPGDKDGIDIGTYIRKYFQLPIIYLSGYDNFDNIERVRAQSAEGFVVKTDKPVAWNQLWASIMLAIPKREQVVKRKTHGGFFKVREINLPPSSHLKKNNTKSPEDPIEIETFIPWNDLSYIESYNTKTAGVGNNNVLLHRRKSDKALVMRGSLTELEQKLPEYFVRVDQRTIINALEVTGRSRNGAIYYIADHAFKLSDTYRQHAEGVLQRLLGGSTLT